MLTAIQDAPYSTSPKKGAATTKAATRDQVSISKAQPGVLKPFGASTLACAGDPEHEPCVGAIVMLWMLTPRPPLPGCLQDTARFIALAGTEFTGIDALPETVVDPMPVVEQPAYGRSPYEVFQETPAAATAQLADAPAAASSPKR